MSTLDLSYTSLRRHELPKRRGISGLTYTILFLTLFLVGFAELITPAKMGPVSQWFYSPEERATAREAYALEMQEWGFVKPLIGEKYTIYPLGKKMQVVCPQPALWAALGSAGQERWYSFWAKYQNGTAYGSFSVGCVDP